MGKNHMFLENIHQTIFAHSSCVLKISSKKTYVFDSVTNHTTLNITQQQHKVLYIYQQILTDSVY